MFWRVMDFSQSRATLVDTFKDEYLAAHVEMPKARSGDKLHGALSQRLRLNESAFNNNRCEFSTRDLSPAVRHFMNDACRILEPLRDVLATQYPAVKIGKKEALNSYLDKLSQAGIQLDFDSHYITELYELWNDYKHRDTKGLHATRWRYENGKIHKPKLAPPATEKTLKMLSGIEVDMFEEKTVAVLLKFAQSVLATTS